MQRKENEFVGSLQEDSEIALPAKPIGLCTGTAACATEASASRKALQVR